MSITSETHRIIRAEELAGADHYPPRMSKADPQNCTYELPKQEIVDKNLKKETFINLKKLNETENEPYKD